MSNAMDLLLKLDKTKLVRPTQEVEIKRLSDAAGEPFIVTCEALTADEMNEFKDTKTPNEDMLIKGIKDIDFTNQKVIEYYGAVNAVEAVNAVFFPGEIASIAEVITKLSGFGKDAVKEVKNESTETAK